jgi:hypothetical protein
VADPAWLTGIFAALMLTVAVYCVGRLAAARRWHRPTEVDTDAGHVLMGVAMAGMLVARLRVAPATAWEAVFAIGAAWFAAQLLRARRRPPTSSWQCLHPAPHLVECAAMLYMLAILPGSLIGVGVGAGGGGGMAAMSASALASRYSFLALVLAVFMFGYVALVTDRLALRPAAPLPVPAGARAGQHLASAAAAPRPARRGRETGPLAPRCAALCKIAMALTMGYMLVLTL